MLEVKIPLGDLADHASKRHNLGDWCSVLPQRRVDGDGPSAVGRRDVDEPHARIVLRHHLQVDAVDVIAFRHNRETVGKQPLEGLPDVSTRCHSIVTLHHADLQLHSAGRLGQFNGELSVPGPTVRVEGEIMNHWDVAQGRPDSRTR